jgi:hypothetical protein
MSSHPARPFRHCPPGAGIRRIVEAPSQIVLGEEQGEAGLNTKAAKTAWIYIYHVKQFEVFICSKVRKRRTEKEKKKRKKPSQRRSQTPSAKGHSHRSTWKENAQRRQRTSHSLPQLQEKHTTIPGAT